MTTAAMSTGPRREQAPTRRVPWRRMAWVIWRQHRLAIDGVVGLLAAAATLVIAEGVRLHHAYAAVSACRPVGAGTCHQAANSFAHDYSSTAGIVAALLQAVPPLIGAFTGAPVLAGVFERGTFRYVFTQGGPATPSNLDPVHYLLTHGFTWVASYQPGGWFWPFQFIESGWLLLLSVLLGVSAIWLIRRQVT